MDRGHLPSRRHRTLVFFTYEKARSIERGVVDGNYEGTDMGEALEPLERVDKGVDLPACVCSHLEPQLAPSGPGQHLVLAEPPLVPAPARQLLMGDAQRPWRANMDKKTTRRPPDGAQYVQRAVFPGGPLLGVRSAVAGAYNLRRLGSRIQAVVSGTYGHLPQ